MVNVKRGHKLCLKCKYLIKQNMFQNNANIPLKIINQLQNTCN